MTVGAGAVEVVPAAVVVVDPLAPFIAVLDGIPVPAVVPLEGAVVVELPEVLPAADPLEGAGVEVCAGLVDDGVGVEMPVVEVCTGVELFAAEVCTGVVDVDSVEAAAVDVDAVEAAAVELVAVSVSVSVSVEFCPRIISAKEPNISDFNMTRAMLLCCCSWNSRIPKL